MDEDEDEGAGGGGGGGMELDGGFEEGNVEGSVSIVGWRLGRTDTDDGSEIA